MPLNPKAGLPATPDMFIDPAKLEKQYYDTPATKPVAFGTSGHRGTASDGGFNEGHILAITQAICEYRSANGIHGPLFIGKDTHLLSHPAQRTAIEVLAANGVETYMQRNDGATPTPVISRAIIMHNRPVPAARADGVVISPSHNPPPDGGFKYNPPNGGPADTDVTKWIEDRANALMRDGCRAVKRTPYETALKASAIKQYDFITPYVRDLRLVVDMDAIRGADLNIGSDPLGGASLDYWDPINAEYGLKINVVNRRVDPTFGFMTVDHDGKIRMDCSSPYAMASLVALKDRFDVAFGNDPDSDRHGIVVKSAGLMNPNHYLAVAIRFLLTHRAHWSVQAAVGKTLVSSSLIDRVVSSLKRKLAEMPVGFKWFAPGLFDGTVCFGGEESAGASFLEREGKVWTTDKDGIILNLLAAEITATTGKDPGLHYAELTAQFGTPYYTRIDVPATPEQKSRLLALDSSAVSGDLAGEKIEATMTKAPANGASIGGVKVLTANGWFAARPSGTENIYKIYAESFQSQEHLDRIVSEAQAIVTKAAG
jgi:phosphoglucomutase